MHSPLKRKHVASLTFRKQSHDKNVLNPSSRKTKQNKTKSLRAGESSRYTEVITKENRPLGSQRR